MLKYIPAELQQEIERLTRRKQELVSKINSRKTGVAIDNHESKTAQTTNAIAKSSSISASRFSDTEIIIQISIFDIYYDGSYALSRVLLSLEEDGLLFLYVSSFQFQFGVTFYI